MKKDDLVTAVRLENEAEMLRKAALRIEAEANVDRTTITLPSSQAARLTGILRKFAKENDDKIAAL